MFSMVELFSSVIAILLKISIKDIDFMSESKTQTFM